MKVKEEPEEEKSLVTTVESVDLTMRHADA